METKKTEKIRDPEDTEDDDSIAVYNGVRYKKYVNRDGIAGCLRNDGCTLGGCCDTCFRGANDRLNKEQ